MKNISVVKTKLIKRFAGLLFAGFVLTLFSACKPALGSSWYPRVNDDIGMAMYITEISVADNPVVPVLSETPIDEADRLNKFSKAKTYIVTVPPSVEEVSIDNIKVKAVNSLSKMEPVLVDVKINGEGAPLVSGQTVPITIKIADNEGKYTSIEKVIKITQSEPYDLELKSLKICGIDAMQGDVSIPYKYSAIDPSNIEAKFKYGENETVIPVEVENSPVELKENDTVNIKIMVKGQKGQYKDFEKVIAVTREAKAEGEDEALQLLEMYVLGIKAEIGKTILVPENTQSLNSEDVVLSFKKFGYIPAEISPKPAVFGSEDIISLKLSVSAKEGKYQAWEMNIIVKKSAEVLYNPIDKNGNKKYVVKINNIIENVDPFDYYNENYEFPASKFDEWVLHMPSMSGIIASYKFNPGSWNASPNPKVWSGTPDICDNVPSEIGSGLKAIDNIKIYRYKTRAERWASGSYTPVPNPHDNRFYFYRFTANASAGVKADNSMFCVDRYSKFLFYYSDPGHLKSILKNIVPEKWTDYAAESSGDHVQFGKPFYMSDPVGYVKEDGSVVLYQWIKDNINASNYHAQENPAFTKPAEKKVNGAGFSPYRNNIVIKKTEVITTENPEYTVAMPIILAQPKALRIALNSTEDAVMEVKTAPVPEGETLSYQWYKNAYQSNEGGTLIPDANTASYRPDKTAETNCYIYCEVTNTNSSNGKTDTVKTDAVKLLISSGPLYTDAAQPKIIKQPENKTLPINTSGNIKLEVEALSMDMGQVSYQWYKNTSNSNENGEKINGETSATLNLTVDTSSVKTEYYYCVATNTNDKVDGNKTATRASKTAKVEVEESYPLIFRVNDDEAGRIIALRNGKPIELNSYVKKGDKIQFLAFCNPNYETQKWDAAVPTGNINMAEITINSEADAKNTVCDIAYIPPGRLGIKARRIKNLSLGDSNSAFTYDFRVGEVYDKTQPLDFKSLWEKRGMKDLDIDEKGRNGEWIAKGSEKMAPAGASCISKLEYIQLNTKLVYYKTTYDISTYYLVRAKYILSDYQQSLIEFKYNRDTDTWKCNTPNDFNIPNVTISYPADFTLTRGETKDFVIKYDYAGKGTAEVTYTLKWE